MERDDTYPFIKKLADNSRPVRDAALESLTKFIATKRSLTLLELQKLYVGIYWTMWYSDRPLTQQRLTEDLAKLVEVVHKQNFKTLLLAFWTIMAREWDNIDKHRIDKFYLLIRRYVGAMLRRVKKEGAEEVIEVIEAVPLNVDDKKIPNALRYHFLDIYLDEIEKVLEEDGEEEYDGLPLKELITPVEKLAQKYQLKTLRKYAQSTVLEDARLVKWGVVEEKEEESEEEDDDDEWGGIKD